MRALVLRYGPVGGTNNHTPPARAVKRRLPSADWRDWHSYDEQGRVYQEEVGKVDPVNGGPHGVLALAAFSTIFKLAGIVVFYPWLDPFARFIVRISDEGSASAVDRLKPDPDPGRARAGSRSKCTYDAPS